MGGNIVEPGRQVIERELEARFVISPMGITSPIVRSFETCAALIFVLKTEPKAEDWGFLNEGKRPRAGASLPKEAWVLLHTRRARPHFDDLDDLVEILTGPIWMCEEGPRRGSFRVFRREFQDENALIAMASGISSYGHPVEVE